MKAKVQIHCPKTPYPEYSNLDGHSGVAKGLFTDHKGDAWVVVQFGYMGSDDGEIAVLPFEIIYWFGGPCKRASE